MTPFLYKLAEHLFNIHGDKLSETAIVFPSRRAGIYFRKYLSELLSKPFWSPSVFSIEDFILEYSSYVIGDDLVLVFELYNVFKKYGETESFDEFYPWGGMLLRDFDEIDKNLVLPSELFRVMKETKDIESVFSLPLEELEHFRSFWKTFSDRELNNVQNEFLKIWSMLNTIYTDFKNVLEEQNIAYEGMVIRKLCGDIESGKISFGNLHKIIFAGFNSLSLGEEKLIKKLIKDWKAEIYWDADIYYTDDKFQEAGKFLHKNFDSFKIKEPLWIENNINNSEKKNISIIGTPLNLGQAKALGDKLDVLLQKNAITAGDKTAVILPDESLLLPVLYSIPAEVKKMNVTMGFPFRNTPLYNFIDLLKNLQLNKKVSANDCVFYHKDVIGLLMHPYVKFSDTEYAYDIVNYIKRYSIIYVTGKKILNYKTNPSPLIKLLFNPVASTDDIIGYLYNILNSISAKAENSQESYAKFEIEYFFSLYEQLNRIKDIIAKFHESVGEKVFWHILTESIKNIKIPFTGEPLEGMQVMGLLESRSLDFDNVFILSMNEGIMPKGNTHNSFIPYNLRRAFHLPTYEDSDSISAYYFYRLIQRAKNIFLFYNTETNDVYSGEKSRFLLQLETELKGNENIGLNHYIVQALIDESKKHDITINKSPGLIERLKSEKHFSATDIINYVSCSLKFYFKKAAKLEEEEALEEYFSPSTFGKIFHSVMQIIYADYIGRVINEKDIHKLKDKLNSDYDAVFSQAIGSIDELKETKSEPAGRNLLFKNIIKKLCGKVLDNDMNEVPFKLFDTEIPLEKDIDFTSGSNQFKIKLYGRIDLIDEKDGIKRILDYKTGNYKEEGRSLKEQLINACFNDPKYKETLQAAFYGYLYLSKNPGEKIELGIYPIKKLDEGIKFIENIDLAGEGFHQFEDNLKKLFSEMFDTGKPFAQTTDTERCKYCPYISICYRE